MPRPVSWTSSCASVSLICRVQSVSVPPSGVNFSALEIRFVIVCRMRSPSAQTDTFWQAKENSICALAADAAIRSAARCISDEASTWL